jgi:hypothetical protein
LQAIVVPTPKAISGYTKIVSQNWDAQMKKQGARDQLGLAQTQRDTLGCALKPFQREEKEKAWFSSVDFQEHGSQAEFEQKSLFSRE